MKNFYIPLITLFVFTYSNAQWTQVGQDIEGENIEDKFGSGVGLNSEGNIVAIGAYLNDGNGDDSGHVRVYEILNGIWTQIGNDIDGEASGDRSGFILDLNNEGDIVAIGARSNDGNGTDSGHVRIYENINGDWNQKGQDINGESEYDLFGQFLSLNGDGSIVVTSSSLFGNENGSGLGQVKIFEFIGNDWFQMGQTLYGESTGDQLGYNISINNAGDIIAIGAHFHDGVNGENSGEVKIYKYIDDIWTQVGQDLEGEAAGDEFGSSISLNYQGNIVAIGALFNDGNGTDSGHVRVYENLNDVWTQIGNDIDGEASEDVLSSVSLNGNGNLLAIGALLNDGNGTDSGHVRVFENVNGFWSQIGQDIDGEEAGDEFGFRVDLNYEGNIIATGGRLNDGINGVDSGHVRVFENLHLGIVDPIISTLYIYPNPVNNLLNISAQEIINTVSISNVLGQVLYNSNVELLETSIDLSGYTTGAYFVKVQMEDNTVIKKIIKE